MNLKPREENAISGLVPALEGGMDPMLALQLYQQTMGSAEARIQAAREMALQKQAMREQNRVATLGQVGQIALEQAASGADMGAIGPLLEAAAASMPGGQSPMVQQGISQMQSSLAGYDASGALGFDEEDAEEIRKLTQMYMQTNPELDIDSMVQLVGEASPNLAAAPTTMENLVRPIVEAEMGGGGGWQFDNPLQGAISGAAVGAGVGMAGGPFAPISVPVGMIGGGILGALADLFN